MGHGGYLYLVNGTTYDWHLSGQTSEFMERWIFPSVIPSGMKEAASVADTVIKSLLMGLFVRLRGRGVS